MTATVGQRQSFGRRRLPITFVVARGESVRHVTVDPRRIMRGAVLPVLGCILLSGFAYFALPGSTHETVPTETALRQTYEMRLANLRTQLDEATSRQFVAQKMVESKVDVLLTQQELIAERYERLEPIFERARENGILPAFTSLGTPVPTPRPDLAGLPLDGESFGAAPAAAGATSNDRPELADTAVGPADPARDAAAVPDLLDPIETASLRQSTIDISQDDLSGFGRAIDYAELQQIANLKALTSEAVERSIEIASVLSSVGIRHEASIESGIGGPYEPVPEDAGFETYYAELDSALDHLEGLRGLSEGLPFEEPMSGKLMSSRFGIRSDPFLGRRALHAGIDYAVRTGTPIRSTASGTVLRAGSAGGYGNLVEIDHGNGLTTRFGHMSRIDVSIGETVERGATIGAVGSTGRSTGPHLHYEIRRNGQAIDPMRFIQAGRAIDRIG
ncbi:M23 family metallopeptidase [Fulvimarina sp. 2208YS6-2-32]|uniref:M23 family metallopeptidase n=1 Tax=Fulvimarina uroteuthidis TaxID=3098149 RepID=A0ABU5I766_9HYPH|nr:M23 family metallopeptidase [Fulvimarina sp. 2208YS6-2-32]MDY8110633.1 M23 family metallopeptidase [Fulvimarina sp. 2208YS6-2-32]